MWCVTLDLYGFHGKLWLYNNYVLVDDKNTESVIEAVRAGVVSEDDIDEVCTVWQYTAEIAESYDGWEDTTVEIDGSSYVVYIYCRDSLAQYFVNEFNYLPEDCLDARPVYDNTDVGCCGDTNSDDEDYVPNWEF